MSRGLVTVEKCMNPCVCVQARKTGEGWKGRWFGPQGPHNTWTFTGKYWDHRERGDWAAVMDWFAPEPPPRPLPRREARPLVQCQHTLCALSRSASVTVTWAWSVSAKDGKGRLIRRGATCPRSPAHNGALEGSERGSR